MNEAQRNVALFRYSLIREAADASLTIRQRGQLVRELASREHVGPNDRRIRVGRATIDRWIRAYRAGGFDALMPESRTGYRSHSPGQGTPGVNHGGPPRAGPVGCVTSSAASSTRPPFGVNFTALLSKL